MSHARQVSFSEYAWPCTLPQEPDRQPSHVCQLSGLSKDFGSQGRSLPTIAAHKQACEM